MNDSQGQPFHFFAPEVFDVSFSPDDVHGILSEHRVALLSLIKCHCVAS